MFYDSVTIGTDRNDLAPNGLSFNIKIQNSKTVQFVKRSDRNDLAPNGLSFNIKIQNSKTVQFVKRSDRNDLAPIVVVLPL